MRFFCVFLKITELLNDVERLKQALNGLSQLTYTTGIPLKRQNQQVEMLQNQVRSLQQQLAVSSHARSPLKGGSLAYSAFCKEGSLCGHWNTGLGCGLTLQQCKITVLQVNSKKGEAMTQFLINGQI